MIDINPGPLLFIMTMVGTLMSIIGIIYVFSAMKYIKYAKFWRSHGIAFTITIITFWLLIYLYILGKLDEWGWLFFIYYIMISPMGLILTLKMRRKLRG